ncbi:serine-rich adhesin for platelets-like [Centroberyx affinis]|uniref:serine-rich adhesin for platelets-like n=1 Tax=Centroberyx affinis TaxID=166261 RepID=UPI003A5C67B7
MLEDDICPEISLLDVTVDTTMPVTRSTVCSPHILPETPVSLKDMATKPEEVVDTNPDLEMGSTLTLKSEMSSVLTPGGGNITMNDSSWLKASLDVTRDISAVDSLKNSMPSLELSAQNMAEIAGSVMIQNSAEDLSSTLPSNVTHDMSSSSEKSAQCIGKNITMNDSSCLKASLEVTQDISTVDSMKNNRHSSEFSGQNMTEVAGSVVIQSSAEDSSCTLPGNVTHDMSASSDKSAQCIGKNITMNDSSRLKASLEVTRDISTVDNLENNRPSLELSGQSIAEHGGPVMIQSSAEDSSCTLPGNVTHDMSASSDKSAQCIGKNTTMNDSSSLKGSLEVTRDISTVDNLENNRPSLELSGQSIAEHDGPVMIQSSAEDLPSSLPVNVTHDMTSTSDKSAQCIISQSSTCDVECGSNSNNRTFELQVEPMESSNPGEPNNTKMLTSEVPQPSLKAAVNSTFTTLQTSKLSIATDLNTAVQISCPQNNTLALPPSNVGNPTAEAEDQISSISKNTFETCPVMNHSCSARETSGLCVLQNNTFNMHSLQKSNGNIILGETSTIAVCLQNDTLDTKPLSKLSGTIALSESSSSPQNTLDMPPSSKLSNLTTSPKDKTFEANTPGLSKLNGTTAGAEANAKTVDLHDSTFEANPVVVAVSGAETGETKEQSQSVLPMTDGLSDTLDHQSMDMENNKAAAFNLDDSLDLRSDSFVTSTPMPDSKMINLIAERGGGKAAEVQKKLYGDGSSKPDGPSKPVSQVAAPSNIVSDRKTFFTVSAAKSLLPPSRAASQLLKYKPVSAIPGRFEPPPSGPPMTRQRAQAEASRNTAASDALPQETTGISSSCNGRTAVTGSKQPSTGLRRPQPSRIPSTTQRAIPSLRPPSARSNTAAASSNTDKPRGPTATNPMKTAQAPSQAKKHLLTSEALPLAKKKKMDAPVPPASAEASTSSCDPASRARNLKLPATSQRATPKPQSHGCANCAELEQQLKKKSEEITRLKEELLKYKRRKDEC